jgi:hypothetical protein
MTATPTAPVEALLREQVAKGHFPSLDRALEAAVKTVDGHRASRTLESLLEEALSPSGKRGPPFFPEGATPHRWDNRRDEH